MLGPEMIDGQLFDQQALVLICAPSHCVKKQPTHAVFIRASNQTVGEFMPRCPASGEFQQRWMRSSHTGNVASFDNDQSNQDPSRSGARSATVHTCPMTELSALVPLRVDPTNKTVTLADVGPEEFTDAFFEYTVRRVLDDDSHPSVVVSWDELISESQAWSDRHDVAGLIFNVGRCGSTLLANMMKQHRSLWVLSEPEPLAKPELVSRRTPTLSARTEAEALYRANSILLQRRAATAGRRLVIKYPSWLAARAPTMAATHSEAAVFGLYRDPQKVVASYIQKPPAFADAMHTPVALQMSVTPSMAALANKPLTGASYYASIWISTMIGAMAVDDERLMLLNYRQLADAAPECIGPVMRHLGVNVDGETHDAILAATRSYAKPKPTADSAQEFDPSGVHARKDLSPRTRAEIASIIGTLPDILAAHPRHLEI